MLVVGADGSFYKALFDPATDGGGECTKESYAKFIDDDAPAS